MLDKLGLHNSMQTNKKYMQQAKVNIITKLVHKIRKLKKLKEEDNSEDDKLNAKISKKLEVLTHLKKFKGFQILKEGLLYKKNPQVVITNGNALPKDLAFAMLFSYKKISEIIKSLKETFDLNDNDSSWRKIVMEFGKKRKPTHSKNVENKQGIKNNKKSFKDKDNDDNEEKDFSKTNSLPSEKKSSIKYEKKSSVTRKKRENLSEFSCSKATQEAVDPFFVTSTGDNYVSTVIVNHDSKPFEDTSKPQFIKTDDSYSMRKSRFNKQINQTTKNNGNKFRNVNLSISRQIKEVDINISTKNPFVRGKNAPMEESSEDLHPSWKAKKNLKPVITEFKGKKVIFDDE